MAKSTPTPAAPRDTEQAERALGRYVAYGLPTATIVGALGVAFITSLGPALLVLAGGALLGTVAFFWASVRTLSGDAPLPSDLEAIAVRRSQVDVLAEKKQSVLLALKDLEHERSIGKIDEADFEEVSAVYREQAKAIMREMDEGLGPLREKAERLAENYLKKRGLADGQPAPAADSSGELPPAAEPDRLACAKCSTSNEADATFCKKCGGPLSKGAVEEAKDALA
jgi:hypothetical protein